MARVKTGIPGLDAYLNGGIPEYMTTVITGSFGTGKTIFATQFALYGARKKEPTVYAMFDENPKKYKYIMKRMGWNLEKVKNFIIYDAYSTRAETITKEKELATTFDVQAIADDLYDLVEKAGAKRLVIDSVVPLILLSDSPHEIRRNLTKIFNFTSSGLNCTSLIISETPDTGQGICRFDMESFLSDGLIYLGISQKPHDYQRYMQIMKMRGTDHYKDKIPFNITAKKGIQIVESQVF